MKEIRQLKAIYKNKRNLNTKRHLLQNYQNADTTLFSHDEMCIAACARQSEDMAYIPLYP